MRKKPKGMANGGMMRKVPKGMAAGGTKGEKLKMVKDPDTGDQVPFFTVDGKGKMANGGQTKVPKTKGYFKGGRTMKNKMNTKGGKMGGKG
mgnify:FL=1|jgi:hypothetical protein